MKEGSTYVLSIKVFGLVLALTGPQRGLKP
jgi:hypothetical protein